MILQQPLLLQLGQQVVQGVALAHLHLVEPLKDHGPVLPGKLCGLIGAVVRHHIGGNERFRVVLSFDAVQQVRKYRFLIPGGDENGEPPLWRLPLGLLPVKQQGDDKIQGLIQEHDRNHNRQNGYGNLQKMDKSVHRFLLVVNLLPPRFPSEPDRDSGGR